MRTNTESNKEERRSAWEHAIPSNLPEVLEGTAQVLKDNGCSQTLIRAALLSICGIEVRSLSLPALCVY